MMKCTAFAKLLMCSLLAGPMALAQQHSMIVVPGNTVDRDRDPVNIDVVANSVYALSARLEISGSRIVPVDVKVVRIPASLADFSNDPSRIIVEAFNQNDVLVGRTSVADRNMIARDGKTIIRHDRTVSVIVPILSKPTSIAFTLPGTAQQAPVSVTDAVRAFCTDFRAEPICSDAPPEDSPFFDRLRVP